MRRIRKQKKFGKMCNHYANKATTKARNNYAFENRDGSYIKEEIEYFKKVFDYILINKRDSISSINISDDEIMISLGISSNFTFCVYLYKDNLRFYLEEVNNLINEEFYINDSIFNHYYDKCLEIKKLKIKDCLKNCLDKVDKEFGLNINRKLKIESILNNEKDAV